VVQPRLAGFLARSPWAEQKETALGGREKSPYQFHNCRLLGDCSSITGVEAVRKTEGQAYLLRQTRFCVCLSKVVAVLLPGAEATCQPKPNGWLWLHICLTRGFSDRLFDRGKDATLSCFIEAQSPVSDRPVQPVSECCQRGHPCGKCCRASRDSCSNHRRPASDSGCDVPQDCGGFHRDGIGSHRTRECGGSGASRRPSWNRHAASRHSGTNWP
jgi:hypothetical protein